MSVAFRRDSDEEHLEPKFEVPVPPGPNLVTPRGLTLIAAKVVALQAAVDAARDETREALKRDLRYWHTRQTTAVLAPSPEDEVGIGSRVTALMKGIERVIEIVGMDEAEPAAGRIGFQSPLARALIGASVGERVTFSGVEDAIEVVAIAPIG